MTELTANQIQKYQKYSIPQLIKKAERKFNKFIRTRDLDKPCISCGRYSRLEAGHYYSGGHHPALRFNELNVNGQCKHCNCDAFLSGNLIEYRKGLVRKIGVNQVEQLDETVDRYKQIVYKWNRFFLIEVIEKYR